MLLAFSLLAACEEEGPGPSAGQGEAPAEPAGSAVPTYPVQVELAPGAAERIPSSGVLVTLTAVGDDPAMKYRGWVRADGSWYGPELPKGRYQVAAQASGWATSVPEVLDYSHPNHRPKLQLDVTRDVRVIVSLRDSDSRLPVTQATVTLEQLECEACEAHVVPAHSGSFVLDGIEAGGYKLGIQAPGYVAPRARRVELNQTTTVVESVLESGTVAHGRVVSADGPVANARVVATRPHGQYWVETVTDRTGRFELSPIRPGEFFLATRGRGFAPHLEGKWQVLPDGSTPEKLVELDDGQTLVGTVTDASTHPVPAVRVAAVPLGPELGDLLVQEAVSEADGSYRFEHFPGVAVRMRFEHPDYPAIEHHVVHLGEEGLARQTIRLGNGQQGVRFAVVDEADRPLDSVKIELAGNTSALLTRVTAADGLAEFGRLGSENDRWTITRDGYESQTIRLAPTLPTLQQTIRLRKLARVSGSVMEAVQDWVPEGTRVVLRKPNQTLTAAVVEGRFDFGTIRAGEYESSVRLFALVQSPWRPLVIEDGSENSVDLVLPEATSPLPH